MYVFEKRGIRRSFSLEGLRKIFYVYLIVRATIGETKWSEWYYCRRLFLMTRVAFGSLNGRQINYDELVSYSISRPSSLSLSFLGSSTFGRTRNKGKKYSLYKGRKIIGLRTSLDRPKRQLVHTRLCEKVTEQNFRLCLCEREKKRITTLLAVKKRLPSKTRAYFCT